MIFGSILDRFWSDFGVKNRSKSNKNLSKNESNIRCNCGSILDGSWVGFGGSLGALGPILAPSREFLGRFGLQVGAQNRSKSVPRAIWNAIIFIIDLKIDFGSDLVRIWPHLGLQNLPKMRPSWLQNRLKSGCWFESCFWKDLGTIFIDFLSQHDMAEVAKSMQKTWRFLGFCYIGNFALLCCWFDFSWCWWWSRF